MKTKMTATLAVAIVAVMVFAAAGATTYSWFSDSEETDVTISTATIDISGQFTVGELTVNGNSVSSMVFPPVVTINGNSIEITGALDKLNVPLTYKVKNLSTTDAFWRMYTDLPAGWEISDVEINNNSNNTASTGMVYLAGSETAGVHLGATNNITTVTFNLIADNLSADSDYSFTFVSEAYQFGYNYSAPVNMKSGIASIGNVSGQDVKVEGQTSGAQSLPIIMEFSQNTNDVIKNKTLQVTSSDNVSAGTIQINGASNPVVLDITLGSSTGQVDLGGYVTITVTIPETVPDAAVYYNDGNEAFPVEIVGSPIVNGGKTTITFKTNHFSEYVIVDSEFEAAIDKEYYCTLSDAMAAYTAGTIKVLKDISVDIKNNANGKAITPYVAYEDVVIDLNGHTIAAVSNTTANGNYAVFDANKAELTLKNTSQDDASITLTHNGTNMGWNAYSAVISVSQGSLKLDNITVSHNNGTDMAYGIDVLTNGKSGAASANISNSIVESTYTAIRMFANSTTDKISVVLNDSKLDGDNRGLWVQYPSSNSTYGQLVTVDINSTTVNGDKRGIYVGVPSGSTADPQIFIDDKSLITNNTITEGAMTYSLTVGSYVFDAENIYRNAFDNKAGGKELRVIGGAGITNSDGNLVVYPTLQAAIDAAAVGDVIYVFDDINTNATIIVSSDDNITLNLNGHTINGIFDKKGATGLINNLGTLKIVGNGTIICLAQFPDVDWGTEGFPTYANNTINNRGNLTVCEGVTIQNDTNTGGASYAIDNYEDGVITIEGGILKAKDVAIRMFSGSATMENKLVINDGYIEGKRALWIQLPSNNASVAPLTTVVINGGVLKTNSPETQPVIYSYSYGNSFANTNVTITGGEFFGDVAFGGGYKGDKETVSVTGGTFHGYLGRYLSDDGWEDITINN